MAREAEKQHGLSLSIGIGFGCSANEAGTKDAGLIEITGEAKGVSKGRPKQIYQLTFLRKLNR